MQSAGLREEKGAPGVLPLPAFSPNKAASWLSTGAWDDDYPSEIANAVKQLRKANAADRPREIRALPKPEEVGGIEGNPGGKEEQVRTGGKEGYGEIDVPVNEKGMSATDVWAAAKGQLQAETPGHHLTPR